MRATVASECPLSSNRIARRRRRSNSTAVPFGLMAACIPHGTGICITYARVNNAVKVLEHCRHLLAAEHNGETRRSFGADDVFEARQVDPEDVPVEEQQRAERLILRGRRHAPLHGQARKERGHLRRGHLDRVTLSHGTR